MIPSAEKRIDTKQMTRKYSGQLLGAVCTTKNPIAVMSPAIKNARAKLPST